MSILEVENLSKTYGEGTGATTAIGDLSFTVEAGEFVCIVGPSGCGKSTLLKCMSGLMSPTSGSVRLAGRPVTEPPATMALVFQEYGRSLFPWMSVWRNVALPLHHKPLKKSDKRQLVSDAIDAVGLSSFADHYPWQLSGGMQQRVAIARALAYQPEVLLMDEPFASVDAQTRSDLEDLVLDVRARYGVTVVFVTHDIDESVYLSDRIVILTAAPTEVKETLTVGLPHPRDQVATKELPEFAQLRAHTYQLIMRPVETQGATTTSLSF
jgi:NitT/TauT family transport system ATP-binding protein